MHLGMQITPVTSDEVPRLQIHTTPLPAMPTKKPRTTKKAAAKRPSKKQAKEIAELASREALKVRQVEPMPEVTPMELAHLVAAMGFGEQADGPAKALSLLSRSAAYIEGMKAEFKRLDNVITEDRANMAKIMMELGLSKEDADKTFSVEDVIAKMDTAPLMVAGRMLRGKGLWNEFRRQVDPKPGRPGKADEEGASPEEYLLSDLLRVYQEFIKWRVKIAAANKAKGSKNLDKANRERKKRALADGAEAVDAVPLPKMLKQNTSGY
jgi:hypothetical protein